MTSGEPHWKMLQPDQPAGSGPLGGTALAIFEEWDPDWVTQYSKLAADPWTTEVLPRKTVELINTALNASTACDPDATRRHVRAALDAGASREEILIALKMASLIAIHSAIVGARILVEEARAAGVAPEKDHHRVATPLCDKMRAAGRWDNAWDPVFQLDPAWTEQFMTTASVFSSGVLTAKMVELLSIALDASYTRMYVAGARRHIRAALGLGATVEEITEVLKLCVVHGVQACNLGVPILAAEIHEHVTREVERT